MFYIEDEGLPKEQRRITFEVMADSHLFTKGSVTTLDITGKSFDMEMDYRLKCGEYIVHHDFRNALKK